MTEYFEDYYLVKFINGKIHIVERMGKVTTLCGQSMGRYFDGYIKGNAYFLAKFITGPYGCKTCRRSLETGGIGWRITTVATPPTPVCIRCGNTLWPGESILCANCEMGSL